MGVFEYVSVWQPGGYNEESGGIPSLHYLIFPNSEERHHVLMLKVLPQYDLAIQPLFQIRLCALPGQNTTTHIFDIGHCTTPEYLDGHNFPVHLACPGIYEFRASGRRGFPYEHFLTIV